MKRVLLAAATALSLMAAQSQVDMRTVCELENSAFKGKNIDEMTKYGGCEKEGNRYKVERIVIKKSYEKMLATQPSVVKVGKENFERLLKMILRRQAIKMYCDEIGLGSDERVDLRYRFDNGGAFARYIVTSKDCKPKKVAAIEPKQVIQFFERLKKRLPYTINENVALTGIRVDKEGKKVYLTYTLKDRKGTLADAKTRENFETAMRPRLAKIIKNNDAFRSIVRSGWTFAMQVRTDRGYSHTFTYTKADI